MSREIGYPTTTTPASRLLERYALMQAENARLKAEVESLRKELADAQENYHIVNEMVAKMLKEGKLNES